MIAGNASGVTTAPPPCWWGCRDRPRYGAKPVARIVAGAVAGVPPRVMGLGPVPRCKRCWKRAGLELKDLDLTLNAKPSPSRSWAACSNWD